MKNKFFKSASVYVGVSIYASLIVAFFTFYITKLLDPSDFGQLEIYRTSIQLLVGVLIFGSNTLFFGNYFKFNKRESGDFISTSIYIILALTILIGLFLFLFPELRIIIKDSLKIEYIYIYLLLIISFIQSINAISLTIFQIRNQALYFAIVMGLSSTLTVCISYYYIVINQTGWTGMIYGILISNSIILITSFINFKKNLVPLYPKNNYFTFIIFTGFPLIFSHIGGWVNEGIDKYMISSLLNMEEVGVYSLGYKFGTLVALIQIAILRAWVPYFYKEINNSNIQSKLNIVKYSYLIIIGLTLFALLISILSPKVIILFFGIKYQGAASFIFIIAFAYVLAGVWKLFSAYLVDQNKTKEITFILIISAIINIAANYFFIKSIGIIGAAWATFISFFCGAVLSGLYAQRIKPMPWLFFLTKSDVGKS